MEVTNGSFQVALDFGIAAFNGEQRFLGLGLRCPAGSGSYIDLPERQELTASPYSLYAQQVPWTGITGMPVGIGANWDNVLTVAKSGGQFESVQAAIDSIGDESETNRYLIWIAPGIYEEQIDIPPYVSVRGAGRDLVVLRSFGGASTDASVAVSMATATTLSDLTIEMTGTAVLATGIQATGLYGTPGFEQTVSDVYVVCTTTGNCTGARVNQTTLKANGLDMLIYVPFPAADGGSATGLIVNTAYVEMHDIEFILERSDAGFDSIGIYAQANSSYSITSGKVRASSSASAIGVIYGAGNTHNRLSDLSIEVQNFSSGTAIGISVSSAGEMRAKDTYVYVNGSGTSKGIAITGGSIRIENVEIEVSGPSSTGIEHVVSTQGNYLTNVTINRGNKAQFGITGIAGDTSFSYFFIRDSWINAFTGIAGATNRTYRLTDTMLTTRTAGGTFVCIGVYGELFAVYGPTC